MNAPLLPAAVPFVRYLCSDIFLQLFVVQGLSQASINVLEKYKKLLMASEINVRFLVQQQRNVTVPQR